MRPAENFWTDFEDTLAQQAVELSDEMAEKIRGGPYPPGAKPVPRAEQLRRYLLFARPMAVLAPGELTERTKLRDTWFSKLEEPEIREWMVAMEKLRIQVVGSPPNPERLLLPPAIPPIPSMDIADMAMRSAETLREQEGLLDAPTG